MVFLKILLWLLVAIITIVLLLLIIPIKYKLTGGYKDTSLFFNLESILAGIVNIKLFHHNEVSQCRISFFGLGFSFILDEEDTFLKKKMKSKVKKEKKKENKKSPAPGELLKILLEKGFLQQGKYLLKDVLKILSPDYFQVKGKIGFDEPHYTGWLLALASSANTLCKPLRIDLLPVWEEEFLELEGGIEGKLAIGLIIVKIISFALSKSALTVWKKLYKLNKRKKSCNKIKVSRV